MIPDDVTSALAEYKAGLQQAFGDRLLSVLLFGSYARGVTHEDSDVDVLVLISTRQASDGHRAVDAAVEVMLRRPEVVLSPLVLTTQELDQLRARERQLARDIDVQGIPL